MNENSTNNELNTPNLKWPFRAMEKNGFLLSSSNVFPEKRQDFDASYLFSFSSPDLEQYNSSYANKIIEDSSSSEKTKTDKNDLNNHDYDCHEIIILPCNSTHFKDILEHTFIFSKPDIPNLNNNQDLLETEITILNETSVDTNDNSETEEISDIPENSDLFECKQQCQYWWIYDNCHKCEYCKNVSTDNNNPVPDKRKEVKSIFTNKVPEKKKRKLPYYNTTLKSKRLKWQCQICLTVNGNRERCACCDAQRFLFSNRETEKLYNNFNFNNKLIANLATLNKNVDNALFTFGPNLKKDETVYDIDEQITFVKQEGCPVINNANMIKDEPPYVINGNDTSIKQEIVDIKQEVVHIIRNNETVTSEILMKQEFNTDEMNNNIEQMAKTEKNAEEMEIEPVDLNIVKSETFSPPFINFDQRVNWEIYKTTNLMCAPTIVPQSFQFQMGLSSPGDRQNGRRIRKPRSSRRPTSHK